jgi:hypothetical protein
MDAGLLRPEAAMLQGGRIIAPPAGAMGWLPPTEWGTIKDFYAYEVDFLPIGVSATATASANIQADSNFIIMYATLIATAIDNTTPLAFAPALVDLRVSSSGASITSSPVHVNAMFGDGSFPGVFAVPKFLPAASQLQVTLQNLEAVARNYRLTFFGFRSLPNSNMFAQK